MTMSRSKQSKGRRHARKAAKPSSNASRVDIITIARDLALEARDAYCERRARLKKARAEAARKRLIAEREFQAQDGPAIVAACLEQLVRHVEIAEEQERARRLAAEKRDEKEKVFRLLARMEHGRGGAEQQQRDLVHRSRIKTFDIHELKSTNMSSSKQVEYLITTRGWYLTCRKNHLKYSRQVMMRGGDVRVQRFSMSTSPSDYRARAKALRDLINLEADVKCVVQ